MAQLGPMELLTLRAVIDRIMPADADPGAVALGTEHYIVACLAAEDADLVPDLRAGLAGLGDFAARPPEAQDAALAALSPGGWFARLAELVAEGAYADPGNGGNRDAASWRMIGYVHGLPEGPSGPPQGSPKPRRSRVAPEYDAIVVGAGAGGGIAACMLVEAGRRVLLIERGLERAYADSGQRDHLRNHRLQRLGHNTGPDLEGNPRVFVDPAGTPHLVRPHEPGYHSNAAGVGSGTLAYGGLAWRFLPQDFRMASTYGVPAGSSLADWPLGYDELEPWYDRAEWEIGVAGEPAPGAIRRRGYPMPPVPAHATAAVLAKGAEQLGIKTFTPPILVNSVPRAGRAACIACGSCVGFPCPSDAKNGTQNTVIPRALATGNCDLVTGAMVERVTTDQHGRVTGIAFAQDEAGTLIRREVRARAVVLACGAIETARLLLASSSRHHPRGLGNGHDLVGRNLQGHFYPTAYGLFDREVQDCRGPGVTIATQAYNHCNDGIIGGSMLADDFVMLPAIFWKQALPPELPRWGLAAKDFMRASFRRVMQVKGPVHEIPDPSCRVTLDPSVRDRFGLPAARLSGQAHTETMRTVEAMLAHSKAWLEASGAMRIWGTAPPRRLSGHQHQAGTCRMGSDPRHSVTDSYGRVWGHDNLFVSDASLHPTNGGFNPVLTIMALAFRNGTHIAAGL